MSAVDDFVKDHSLAVFWWRCMNVMGNGDYWSGRRLLIQKRPEKESDFLNIISDIEDDAVKYVKKTCPNSITCSMINSFEEIGLPPISIISKSFSMGAGMGLVLNAGSAWYDNGMPTVQLGHKLAASLMLTNTPSSVIDDIKLPFKSFMIEVPDGLITVDVDGNNENIKSIIVSEHINQNGNCFCYVALGTGSLNYWSVNETIVKLLEDDSTISSDIGPLDFTIEDNDKRPLLMIRRLIAGVCLYINGGGDVKHIGKSHSWNGDFSKPPEKRVFRMTQTVKDNFTEVVKDYISGKGNKLTVQSIVSGHWKRQHFGEGRSKTKVIFVEAYWRGPDSLYKIS